MCDQIEYSTNGEVSRYDLVPHARDLKLKMDQEKPTHLLTLTQKALKGIQYEEQIKNDQLDSKLVENFSTFHGKTRDWIAHECGFGCGKTYEKAKYVIQHGLNVLLDAMDTQRFSVHLIYCLAHLSPEEQAMLIAQDKKAILAYLNKKDPPLSNIN